MQSYAFQVERPEIRRQSCQKRHEQEMPKNGLGVRFVSRRVSFVNSTTVCVRDVGLRCALACPDGARTAGFQCGRARSEAPTALCLNFGSERAAVRVRGEVRCACVAWFGLCRSIVCSWRHMAFPGAWGALWVGLGVSGVVCASRCREGSVRRSGRVVGAHEKARRGGYPAGLCCVWCGI